MPYKAPKATGPRRIAIEGPESPIHKAAASPSVTATPVAATPAQPVAPAATPTAAVAQEEKRNADHPADNGEEEGFEVVAKGEVEQEPETGAAGADDSDEIPPLEANVPGPVGEENADDDSSKDGSVEECEL